MTLPVTFRPRARRDVLEQMLYLAEEASEEMADRFYQAILTTCNTLASQPLSGKSFQTGIAYLRDFRWFPIAKPFAKYLIFYQPTPSGIDVVRVLHGARDIEAVLAEEEA